MDEDSPIAKAFMEIASKMAQQLSIINEHAIQAQSTSL